MSLEHAHAFIHRSALVVTPEAGAVDSIDRWIVAQRMPAHTAGHLWKLALQVRGSWPGDVGGTWSRSRRCAERRLERREDDEHAVTCTAPARSRLSSPPHR